MIVLKVYVTSITMRKAKGYPPILIDPHSKCSGAVAFELMQIEMGQGEVLQRTRCVNHVKSIAQTRREFW